jgi:hypothetical protein
VCVGELLDGGNGDGELHGGAGKFSESGENKAQVVGQIEHGIAYQPFGTA